MFKMTYQVNTIRKGAYPSSENAGFSCHFFMLPVCHSLEITYSLIQLIHGSSYGFKR